MWLLVGELRRVVARAGASKATTTHQVQILAEEKMQSGEIRESIFTFGTNKPEEFTPLVGQLVEVEVSPYARKDGTLGVIRSDDGYVRPSEGLS